MDASCFRGGGGDLTMMPKKTVLIVEDNSVNRRILKKILCSDYEILVEMINSAAAQVLQEKSPGPMSDNSKKEE